MRHFNLSATEQWVAPRGLKHGLLATGWLIKYTNTIEWEDSDISSGSSLLSLRHEAIGLSFYLTQCLTFMESGQYPWVAPSATSHNGTSVFARPEESALWVKTKEWTLWHQTQSLTVSMGIWQFELWNLTLHHNLNHDAMRESENAFNISWLKHRWT